ncbi:MAG TPA: hypothetical protein VE615_07065 [Gaiellaceae bacterium]|nr:hypothetical protein [Gaiellaceae bacterium]
MAALWAILVVAGAAAASEAPHSRTLVTRQPVIAIAADGDRAALVSGSRGVCANVLVWEPTRRHVVRMRSATRSECAEGQPVTRAVALAGTRVAWLQAGGGMTLETQVVTATLAHHAPVTVGLTLSTSGTGDFSRNPVGDGALLAFTVDRRCAEGEDSNPPCPPGRKTGDVISASLWRVAGRGACPNSYGSVRRCTQIARADGELTALAVDAGRVVARTIHGVQLLGAAGEVLQEFSVGVRQASLSGGRLVVRTTRAVEVYDVDSGDRLARLPAVAHLSLEDLDGDILVTAVGKSVTLRRLGDGRTTTIRAGGLAHAQLESSGLFVAGGRRVTFTPMREVLRRLGG